MDSNEIKQVLIKTQIVISRSSASKLYQSKVRQREMYMRLTTARNVLRRGAS